MSQPDLSTVHDQMARRATVGDDLGCARCRSLERQVDGVARELAGLRERLDTCRRNLPGDQPERLELNERETEVLDLMVQGCSNREIATRLHLSPDSVKTRTRLLFRRLGVTNRTQAAVWAVTQPPSVDDDPLVERSGAS